MTYPRPLTEHEKAVAWTILSGAEVDELDVLREQLDAAVATDRCTCGCPSLGIAVDSTRARPTSYSGRPVAEVPWKDGAIMVWIDDGWLSNLEIYMTYYKTRHASGPPSLDRQLRGPGGR
jgi:hypothetical protein